MGLPLLAARYAAGGGDIGVRVARGAIAALLAHVLVAALLRVALPKPAPGDHRVELRPPYIAASLSGCFAEVASLAPFRGPLWFLQLGRIVHLQVLGAKVGWDVGLPLDIRVRDPALLEIGAGSVLEPGVRLEAASMRAGRVHVAGISIGRRCLIGSHVVFLPGVSIAHDVRIEPGALLADDVQVGVAAVVGPGARLARGVTLGAQASVGAGAVLAEGVTLADRARVAAGAFVPAGARLEAGERYPRPVDRSSSSNPANSQ